MSYVECKVTTENGHYSIAENPSDENPCHWSRWRTGQYPGIASNIIRWSQLPKRVRCSSLKSQSRQWVRHGSCRSRSRPHCLRSLSPLLVSKVPRHCPTTNSPVEGKNCRVLDRSRGPVSRIVHRNSMVSSLIRRPKVYKVPV